MGNILTRWMIIDLRPHGFSWSPIVVTCSPFRPVPRTCNWHLFFPVRGALKAETDIVLAAAPTNPFCLLLLYFFVHVIWLYAYDPPPRIHMCLTVGYLYCLFDWILNIFLGDILSIPASSCRCVKPPVFPATSYSVSIVITSRSICSDSFKCWLIIGLKLFHVFQFLYFLLAVYTQPGVCFWSLLYCFVSVTSHHCLITILYRWCNQYSV